MSKKELNLTDIREDPVQHMIECGRILTKKKLNNVTSGNESVIIKEGSKDLEDLDLYITRSGAKLGHLDEASAIVKTSIGKYDGNMTLASSEADIHKEIHRQRLEKHPEMESTACAHGHTLNAAALTMKYTEPGIKEMEIPEEYSSDCLEDKIPIFLSQYGSGAEDMTENLPKILSDHKLALIGHHGAFGIDEEFGSVIERFLELEKACEKIVEDETVPEREREIENRVPDNWAEKYKVAGLSGEECPETGDLEPKTIKDLESDLEGKEGMKGKKKYLNETFSEFREIGQDLTDFSMDPFRRGSLSRRIGDTIYITRSGTDFSDIGKEDIFAFKMGEGDEIKPGLCEGWLHEIIYDNISTNYIARLLPKHSTRYSIHCGDAIIPIDVEGRYLSKRIPVADPGDTTLTKENVDPVLEAIKSNEKVAYVKGLGGISIGEGVLYELLHFLESAESSVKMMILAEKIGVDVQAKQKKFENW